jgi:hypothetical protein
MKNALCERNGECCLYRVIYTTGGNRPAYWDLMARDPRHAIQSASELLPISSKIISAHLKEEW